MGAGTQHKIRNQQTGRTGGPPDGNKGTTDRKMLRNNDLKETYGLEIQIDIGTGELVCELSTHHCMLPPLSGKPLLCTTVSGFRHLGMTQTSSHHLINALLTNNGCVHLNIRNKRATAMRIKEFNLTLSLTLWGGTFWERTKTIQRDQGLFLVILSQSCQWFNKRAEGCGASLTMVCQRLLWGQLP